LKGEHIFPKFRVPREAPEKLGRSVVIIRKEINIDQPLFYLVFYPQRGVFYNISKNFQFNNNLNLELKKI
jgi:hypothetical protein